MLRLSDFFLVLDWVWGTSLVFKFYYHAKYKIKVFPSLTKSESNLMACI